MASGFDIVLLYVKAMFTSWLTGLRDKVAGRRIGLPKAVVVAQAYAREK